MGGDRLFRTVWRNRPGKAGIYARLMRLFSPGSYSNDRIIGYNFSLNNRNRSGAIDRPRALLFPQAAGNDVTSMSGAANFYRWVVSGSCRSIFSILKSPADLSDFSF